jgi:uncharacterized protein
MRLTEVSYGGGSPVQGYGPGFFRVSDTVIAGPILVLPGRSPEPWDGFDSVAAILDAAGDIDVLLVGTGAETAHLPASLRAALEAAGIAPEPMASPSACRTYNVLLGEGRRVGLAALAV